MSKKSKEILKKMDTDGQILSITHNDNFAFDISSNYEGSQICKTDFLTKNRYPFLFIKDASINQLEMTKNGSLIAVSNGSSWNESYIYFFQLHAR